MPGTEQPAPIHLAWAAFSHLTSERPVVGNLWWTCPRTAVGRVGNGSWVMPPYDAIDACGSRSEKKLPPRAMRQLEK
jgi:hypothetical protein